MPAQELSTKFILDLCQAKASDFRDHANQSQHAYASSHNRDMAIEFEAKAQAMEQLVDEIQAIQLSGDHHDLNDQIDHIAREIDPDVFANYNALVERLRNEGHDDLFVIKHANAIYGSAINQARENARESLTSSLPSGDIDPNAYGRGVEDAIAWHLQHAADAEAMAAKEPYAAKRNNFRKRAARHRLYASTIRADLASRIQKNSPSVILNQTGPFDQTSGIPHIADVPVDVQRAYLKLNGEWLDDE